jgi:plastocyanin
MGLIGVFMSLSGMARTFLEGFHAISALLVGFGLLLLIAGYFKGGLPTSARDKAVAGITLLALVSTAATASVMGVGAPAPPPPPTGPLPGVQVIDVAIVEGSVNPSSTLWYDPPFLRVVIGVNNTVLWTNRDIATHTVTERDGVTFDSGNINPNAIFRFTFREPGSYEYYCTLHPWMVAQVEAVQGG